MVADLLTNGWAVFPHDDAVARWAGAARAVAAARIGAPEQRHWLHCEGTWFVGVDTLSNDAVGAVAGSGPLPGAAFAAARALYGILPLHAGQVSVIGCSTGGL